MCICVCLSVCVCVCVWAWAGMQAHGVQICRAPTQVHANCSDELAYIAAPLSRSASCPGVFTMTVSGPPAGGCNKSGLKTGPQEKDDREFEMRMRQGNTTERLMCCRLEKFDRESKKPTD